MAQFKLFIKEKNNLIPLTIFDSNQDSVLTFATYDEQFTINNYGQFSLTFNMARYVHVGNEKIENLAAHNIKHGTLIQLVDRYQDVYVGVVTNISYTFSRDNITMSFTVADQFSTELSKRNIGYSLNDNIDAADYIGAMTLDAGARRIIADCKITGSYTDVDALTNDIRRFTDQPSYNEVKSFSVNGSNAFDALKSLAEFYGMDIKVNGQSHSFGFVPLKNPLDKGLRLSPLLNLSSFNLTTDSQSMLTVMNVQGVEMPNGDYLTLLSSIPPSILSGFNTDDWKDSIFYANMFQDYLESNSTELSETERNFLATVYYVPMLENKLINIDYYMENQFLTEQERNELYDLFYNDLRIANGKLIYHKSQLQQAVTHSNSIGNDFLINSEHIHAALEAGLTKYIDNDDIVWNIAFDNYIENYNTSFPPIENRIYNRDARITQSFNRYNNAYQNFLEAIYNGRAYWNAPISDTVLTSNGEYYCSNIDATENEVVIQCAQIATALSGYGERAVSEGKYAGFGLPKTGDVVKLLPELSGRKAGYAPLSISGGIISINDNIVPNPTLINGLGENLITNGNFSNGTTDWHFNKTYASETAENGTVKYTITTSGATATQISIFKSFASLRPVVGKTYYASFKVKSNVNTAKCYFGFGKSNVTNTQVTTSWQRCSNAYTADNSNVYLQFYFSVNYDVGNIYYLDDVVMCDITDLVSRGILPQGLTNAQYKEILDVGVQSTPSPLHDVNGLYSTTIPTDDSYYAAYDMEHNQNVFIPRYIRDNPTHWYFQIKTGFQKTYYEINTDTYFTYKNILNTIDESLPKEGVEGLAANQLKYAAELADWPIPGYKAALAERDAIWWELYQKYGNVILENYYEDTTATNAELLLNNALTKFELLSRPEPTYNLSMIDIYNINNAGLNKVEITDQILLDDKVIENKPGELQKLLSERLYISSINYNLRSDAEIGLTVNPVKYDDILLKRFVKLL